MKSLLRVAGHGAAGEPVFAGAYRFCETHGMPLEDLLAIMRERGAAIDVADYINGAVAAGMKRDRAIRRVATALRDSGCSPVVADQAVAAIEARL